MEWISDSLRSPMPVYYWAKLIGLAPFTVKNNRVHPPTLLGKLYPLTLGAAYLAFIMILIAPKKITILTLGGDSELLRFWIASGRYPRFITVSFTLTIFALSYDKIQSLMNNLCTIGEELKMLGIKENYGELFKNILVTTASKNMVVAALCFAILVLKDAWGDPKSIEFMIGHVFTVNISLIYAQVLTRIKQRFGLLNERLLNVLEPAHRDPESREVDQLPTDLQKIQKIEALHLDLCDLMDETISLFKIPILGNAYDLFAKLTLFSHLMYNIVVNLSSPCGAEHGLDEGLNYLPISVAAVTLLLFEALIIADASSTTCEEGKTTGAVLFQVWNKFEPLELKDEFAMFSVQMMQKPIGISIWGIFDVDYSLIHKIVCTAAAYLFILIQMTPQPPCP